MHTQPMRDSDADFDDWKTTAAENPEFRCRQCGSHDVRYRVWESSCGGYEDYQYECLGCHRKWWVEGADA